MLRPIAAVALALLATPCALRAQGNAPPEPLRATIVHIDGSDVFIDVGERNLLPGATLTVYRRVEVRHPVTRKKLVDRFPIGVLRVERPGATLSLTRVDGAPAHPFTVGDAVEAAGPQLVAAEVALPQSATPSPPTTTADAPAEDPEVRELLRYFYATLGKPPAQRIGYYSAYVKRYPSSRFVESVRAELAYLTQLEARPAQASPRPAPQPRLAEAVHLDPITRAREGDAIELAVAHDRTSKLRTMIVHARNPGDESFTSLPLAADGRGHARARLPAELAGADGVEYFVEGVSEDGKVEPVFASASHPHHARGIPIEGDTPSRERRTRVRFSSELVSFDGTSGRDYFLMNEGDFLYRVKLGALAGVRMGYGHYRGQGGTVEQLDELKLDPEEAGFSYGFVQADLEMSELVGASVRATVGLGRPEQADEQRDGMTGGFQLRARIGRAEGTHLVLAGELLPEIGQRAYLGLRWEAIADFPMGAEVHVTDQPVNSDELAVRLVYEIGYRFTERFALALRPSYQLRTIKHAGPGMGMAATFDW